MIVALQSFLACRKCVTVAENVSNGARLRLVVGAVTWSQEHVSDHDLWVSCIHCGCVSWNIMISDGRHYAYFCVSSIRSVQIIYYFIINHTFTLLQHKYKWRRMYLDFSLYIMVYIMVYIPTWGHMMCLHVCKPSIFIIASKMCHNLKHLQHLHFESREHMIESSIFVSYQTCRFCWS